MIRPQAIEPAGGPEYRLLETAQRLGRQQERRWIVQVHLSRLRAHNRREHYMRIAANMFETAVSGFEGQLFRVSNYDLFFIFRSDSPHDLDEAVAKLRRLFKDDPVALSVGDGPGTGFCTWYESGRDLGDLLTTIQSLHSEALARQKQVARDVMKELPPINPHRLGELIDIIASADLSNVMRRQTVFALVGGQGPQRLFRELFIAVAELQKTVLPNYNIFANRSLFQFLTETLDRRMLALLLRNDDGDLADSYSLNLNISTILSPEFLAFDSSLPQRARGTIVLEVQVADVYADIASFQFARDYARERGYRVCLDGVSDISLRYIDRERLGVDLMKLHWHPEMGEDGSPEHMQQLREMVAEAGKAKIILCHVDSEQAIRWGHSLGIVMYQGRYLDQLVTPRPAMVKPR